MPERWCVIAVILTGCGGEDSPGPSTEDFALAADGLASIDSEAAVVDAIELSLTGDLLFVPDPDQEDQSIVLAAAAGEASAFAMTRLSPAGCIQSTSSANAKHIVTHQLTGCSVDGRSVSGTVTSTWSYEDGLHADHEALDLQIDGRAFDLIIAVTGYATGSVQTRQRTLTLSTDALVVDGAWVATLDTSSGCGSKDGTSTAAIAGTVLDRRDRGLAWCGDGVVDTLTAGRVELVRGTASIDLEFLGDGKVAAFGDGYTLDSTVSELRD